VAVGENDLRRTERFAGWSWRSAISAEAAWFVSQ